MSGGTLARIALCAAILSGMAGAGAAAPRLDRAGLQAMHTGGCEAAYGDPVFAPVPSKAASGKGALDAIRSGFGARVSFGRPKNVSTVDDGKAGGPVIRVRYPEGSTAPSARHGPDGGLGFYAPLPGGAATRSACLRYSLRFAPDFTWVRGGKLPGLFSALAPSGGARPSGDDGYSVRLMWRADGAGELYLYAPNMVPSSDDGGMSLGRGSWRFQAGKWTDVQIEVVLNSPGAEDGRAGVWIDGVPVLAATGIVYRQTGDIGVDGLMFSTFFGGHTDKFAPASDQSAEFRGFRIHAR